MNRFLKKLIIPAVAIAAMGLVIGMNGNYSEAAKKANSSKDFKYVKVSGGVEITKYKGKSKKVVIPDKIAGKKVVSIGKFTFHNNDTITSVTMPDTVTAIKRGGFQNCTKLKSVKLSKKLENIDYSAFKNSGITSIKMPDTVKKVGMLAFQECSNLKSVELSEKIRDIPMACFSGDKKLEKINLDNIESIGLEAFRDNEALLGSINLSNVYNVDRLAFYGCSKITDVIFSDKLQQLGYLDVNSGYANRTNVPGAYNNNPFAYCSSLQNFVLPPENVNFTLIDGAIYGKTGEWLIAYPAAKTGQITLGNKIKGVSDYAFSSSGLTSVSMGSGLNVIGVEAFASSKIQEVNIPLPDSDITPIWNYKAFKNCKELTKVTFPDNIRSTYDMAFINCTALKDVKIPDSVECISKYMFYGCSSLESVSIPGKVTRIPGACFFGCRALKSVNLDNIQTIGMMAFKDCESLAGTLTLNASSLEKKAFEGCINLSNVIFNKSVEELGDNWKDSDEILKSAYDFGELESWGDVFPFFSFGEHVSYMTNPFGGCTNLASITIPQGGNVTVVDGVVYSADMKYLIACPQTKTGKFNIPFGVEYVCPFAFQGSALEEIVMSNSVTEIGYRAIMNCSVKKITLSKSIVWFNEINNNYFGKNDCNKLEEINVNSGNKYYYSEDGVLYKKGKTKHLLYYPPAKKDSKFTVPKNVYIDKGAFTGCRYLKKVVIPEGIKRCGYGLFSKCKGIKLYLPKSMTKCDSSYNTDYSKINYAFDDCCSKCIIMVKKGSKLIKQFDKNKVKYGLY